MHGYFIFGWHYGCRYSSIFLFEWGSYNSFIMWAQLLNWLCDLALAYWWSALLKSLASHLLNETLSWDVPWSSLVEGDEQLDQPNSQTCMEWCHASAAYIFLICHKHISLPLGQVQPSSPLTTTEIHGYSFAILSTTADRNVSTIVTWWWNYLFSIGPLSTKKICPRLLKFYPSGEISPNLVTLVSTYFFCNFLWSCLI